MQYSLTLAALAAGTLTLAAPATEIVGRSTFTVNQVNNGRKVFKNGPAAIVKASHKYGFTAPAKVHSAAAAVQSGTAPANPLAYDEAYEVPVTVGSSKLNLDFDTGSSDLWVFSTVTPSSESSGHHLYNTASGKKKSGYTWNIGYGDGSGASGTVYSDKVVVGGVTATSQAVEAATSVSSSFSSNTGNDGLLGLAFSSINTVQPQQQTTFFDTVKSTLAKPLFTASLKKGRAGAYDFGYLDSSKYTGSISYTAVDNSQGFWGFTAGSYAAGNSGSIGSVGSAIADTGTTLLLLASDQVDNYYSYFPDASYDDNNGGYTFPCSSTPPNFTVKIGSYTATVPGSFINYAPTDDSGETCFGGIQSVGNNPFAIFGDIFLKSQFVVFDETTSSPRLGLAKPSSL